MTSQDPKTPDRWADLLDPRYDFPDEIKGLPRGQRRRAKKEHRKGDLEARKQWILDQRQRSKEPQSAARGPGALLVIVLLVAAVYFVSQLGEDEADEASPTATAQSTEQASSEPAETPAAEAVPVADINAGQTADEVLLAWAAQFYNRAPGESGPDYGAFLSESTPWMTQALFENLRDNGDSTYDYLAQTGGSTTLVNATASAPPEGAAPVDTETRATRVLTITTRLDVEGTSEEITTPLLVELAYYNDQWLVASIAGGVE